MMGSEIVLCLLLLHIICCVLIWLAAKHGMIDADGYFLPFLVLVPFFGAVCVLAIGTKNSIFGKKLALPTLEKLRINEEIHRSMIVENSGEAERMVPLEEALIVNDPASRRRLILSAVGEHPESYMEILQQARMNEDAEVVHYAATAMAQIEKEEDIRLQKMESLYASDPQNKEARAAYTAFLKQYLELGIAQGRTAEIQKRQYEKLLAQELADRSDGHETSESDGGIQAKTRSTANEVYGAGSTMQPQAVDSAAERKSVPPGENPDTALELAKVRLELGMYAEADDVLGKLTAAYPEKEAVWLLCVESCARRMDGAGLKKTMDEMRARRIYLSAKGREQMRFWGYEPED